MFRRAIVRPPAANFADGLTTANLGLPDLSLAMAQHTSYCQALEQCGLRLTHLEADARYPDSTFVEDTAILTEHGALLSRPGAPSRAGEVKQMRQVLESFYPSVDEIGPPGTLDGGDICEADNHFFIGVSERTNEAGAQQLAAWLAQRDITSSCIDIRGMSNLLHLKSGIAYLGDRRLVVIDALAQRTGFEGYQVIHAPTAEEYAANCVRINDFVLVAAGFPHFTALIEGLGYRTIQLDMSEYRKMDGGLSCLSLRF
jgi:dimethylargininase